MKNRIRMVVAVLCNLLYLSSLAQQPVRQVLPNKPLLFSNLPEKNSLTASLLDQLFLANPSQQIKIPMGGGNFLEGVVKEKSSRNKYVTIITIQCSNYDGALLTLSRIAGTHAAVTYLGRVVNIRYGDILILTEENNQYFFKKEKQSLVIVE